MMWGTKVRFQAQIRPATMSHTVELVERRLVSELAAGSTMAKASTDPAVFASRAPRTSFFKARSSACSQSVIVHPEAQVTGSTHEREKP
jgi:hypothetical protein